MKAFLAAIFLALAPILTAQAGAPVKLNRISVAGSDYVSLTEWARVCGFKSSFDRKTKTLHLVNAPARLSFTVDSRRSNINGVDVLFSLPVVLSGGGAFLISVTDWQNMLQPLLYPVPDPRTQVRTVCLDPGHGGKDTGTILGGAMEKQYTLLLAGEIAAQLRACNIKVVMTRERDQTVDLSQRSPYAQSKGADLFVSLHYNATSNRQINGVEMYCLTPQGMASSNAGGGKSNYRAYEGNIQNTKNVLLAWCLQKSILQNTGLEDRGLKRSRFEVLRETRVPAVLIENGFMTNPSDLKKIQDPVFRKKTAQAIVRGILVYKQTVERK